MLLRSLIKHSVNKTSPAVCHTGEMGFSLLIQHHSLLRLTYESRDPNESHRSSNQQHLNKALYNLCAHYPAAAVKPPMLLLKWLSSRTSSIIVVGPGILVSMKLEETIMLIDNHIHLYRGPSGFSCDNISLYFPVGQTYSRAMPTCNTQ